MVHIAWLGRLLKWDDIVAAQGANPRLVTSCSRKNEVELLQG